MNTHTAKKQKNVNRSVANDFSKNMQGNKFTFQFVDNRPEAIAQRKLKEIVDNSPRVKQLKTTQFRNSKQVQVSAQKHYNDGWGAKYNIQTDDALKAKVPNRVKGEGEINLGIYEYGDKWFYKGDEYKKGKKCTIQYDDAEEGWGKHKTKLTSIYHCGPSGNAFTKKV
ncbi:MAG: hypothetical protein GXO96_03370 [Nitrospirae bacterium]|nr:hypothetical protein [Candidatus Manganitrophaceae bacterium]